MTPQSYSIPEATTPTQSDAPPAIELSNAHVVYPGDIHALDDISLSFHAHQHSVILGASGSGKTTLLGCLSGRIKATSGRVRCEGSTAVIYQDLRLIKQRSALANVLMGAIGRTAAWRTLTGFPAAERVRALELLRRVGLEHRVHHRVGRLSGGEQQRVAIARALMQNPAILLADEPIAALDAANADAILTLMTDLTREHKITLVSVLHDRELAEKFADRIIGLEGGRLAYDSAITPALRFRPSTLHAATSQQHPQRSNAAPPAHVRPAWMKPPVFAALILIAVVVYVWSAASLNMDAQRLSEAGPGLWRFLTDLLPATMDEIRDIPWITLGNAMIETMQISLLGTTLGVVISLPLAALAARNLAPVWVCSGVRFFLSAVRTVPSLIWAMLFVSAIGFGAVTGVLALVAYSVGYLTKFFYEAFESVDPGPPDALREIGAGGVQRFYHAVWPASTPAILSSTLFMLEYNVRAASVLGIVDAGGIGYWIKQFIEYRQFPRVIACLLMLFIAVIVIDWISTRLRGALVRP